MKLYRTTGGPVVERDGSFYRLDGEGGWDSILNRDDLLSFLEKGIARKNPSQEARLLVDRHLHPPISGQEVWAAGVTYYRSRDARMEESSQSGGEDFYDRVYRAHRPELFFKAAPHRVVGHGQSVRIRRDSTWNVPEPELVLVLTSSARIVGYTVGNDMSSRDIEGENPLYLPQAKIYDQSCSLGPGVLVTASELPRNTWVGMKVHRGGAIVFEGSATLGQMKRSPRELVDYLYRDNSFPKGCFLMTGTGVVPDSDFSLLPKDEIHISIESVGLLVNHVVQAR